MKHPALLALLLVAPLCQVHAQDKDAAQEKPADQEEMAQWQQDFLNLPEDRREAFTKHLNKAQELFQQKRIFETINELTEAESIFADSPDIENIKGACQTEFRNFDAAMKNFERANTLAPDQPNILFNVAEILFVTKQWAGAEQALTRIMGMLDQEDQNQMQMLRLVEFKLLLCKLKLGKTDEAGKMAVKYDHLDDSPYIYYAEAAIAYENDDEITAQMSLARAQRIFQDPATIAPWQDTMMEYGYIKSFFGGDLEELGDGE